MMLRNETYEQMVARKAAYEAEFGEKNAQFRAEQDAKFPPATNEQKIAAMFNMLNGIGPLNSELPED